MDRQDVPRAESSAVGIQNCLPASDGALTPAKVARRSAMPAAESTASQRLGSNARERPRAFEGQARFAAYIAHELRTPLATQRALLELALADPNADLASWREIGKDVLGVCRQQERLLEACLALARSQGGLQRREPVDLAAIAAEALRTHESGELDRVIVLETAWTAGDPDLLDRLVANLVSNSIRHNIGGGQIEVITYTVAGCATLTIANSGPPISAAALDRLFQPFQRLDSNPKTFSDGVGLGLPIVQAIIDAHDATLTAQARPGGGLGVDVVFPRFRPSRTTPSYFRG